MVAGYIIGTGCIPRYITPAKGAGVSQWVILNHFCGIDTHQYAASVFCIAAIG